MIMYEVFDGDDRTYYHDQEDAIEMADLKADVTDYGMNGFVVVDRILTNMAGKKLAVAILNDATLTRDGSAWIDKRTRIYERNKP